MVKNTKGGNKAKKIGRKFIEDDTVINVRYKKEEEEIYCIVTKILGGENCEVICEDAKTRLCVIRGKFRGKKKRNNLIKQGSLILAGKRDWEIKNINKRDKCDLLYIYNNSEKNKIIKSIENESVKKILQSENDTTENLEFININDNDTDNNENINKTSIYLSDTIENQNQKDDFSFDFDSI